MALPMVIGSTTKDRAVTSFDFLDIAKGSTNIQTYGCSVSGSYLLTDEQVYSNAVDTEITSGSTYTFDYAFEKAKILTGNLLVNIPQSILVPGAPAQSLTWKVEPFHYDGSTETSIATAQSTTGVGANTANASSIAFVKLPLTKTKFKANQILRIKITAYLSDGGANSDGWMHHDPKNRSTTITTLTHSPVTVMQVFIPVVIDI